MLTPPSNNGLTTIDCRPPSTFPAGFVEWALGWVLRGWAAAKLRQGSTTRHELSLFDVVSGSHCRRVEFDTMKAKALA